MLSFYVASFICCDHVYYSLSPFMHHAPCYESGVVSKFKKHYVSKLDEIGLGQIAYMLKTFSFPNE